MTALDWLGVLAVSLAGTAVAFFLAYFLWFRRVTRRLFETQVMLYKVTALFQKAQKQGPGRAVPKFPASSARKGTGAKAAAPDPSVPEGTPGRRISMSVEGRAVEIVEIDGREVVRFAGGDLSEAQRGRILSYLRDEGFIS